MCFPLFFSSSSGAETKPCPVVTEAGLWNADGEIA